MGNGVRKACAGDVEHILDIAIIFNDEYVGIPLNPDKARTSLSHLIEDGVCYVHDLGAIVGEVYDDPFRDRTVLLEIGWYAKSDSRVGLTLLRRFIAAGREQGVDAVVMSTMNTSSERTRKLLDKMGFERTETGHTLEL